MKWWRWLSRLSDDKLPPNMLRHILDDISVSVYLRYGEKMNVSQSVWCVAALTWIFRARMSMSEFSDRIQPYPRHWCQCTEHCPKQRSICFSFKNVDDKNSDAHLRRTHIHTPYQAMGTKQSDLSIANWIFLTVEKRKLQQLLLEHRNRPGLFGFRFDFLLKRKSIWCAKAIPNWKLRCNNWMVRSKSLTMPLILLHPKYWWLHEIA